MIDSDQTYECSDRLIAVTLVAQTLYYLIYPLVFQIPIMLIVKILADLNLRNAELNTEYLTNDSQEEIEQSQRFATGQFLITERETNNQYGLNSE